MPRHPRPSPHQQLTIADIADLLDIKPSTWRSYVTRGQAPEPDGVLGRTPWWRGDTVMKWMESRPGPGRWGPRENL